MTQWKVYRNSKLALKTKFPVDIEPSSEQAQPGLILNAGEQICRLPAEAGLILVPRAASR